MFAVRFYRRFRRANKNYLQRISVTSFGQDVNFSWNDKLIRFLQPFHKKVREKIKAVCAVII